MARRRTTDGDMLMCRTFGHAWDYVSSDGSQGPKGGEPFWVGCVRCASVRRDFVALGSGELLSRRYVYEDAYRHAFDDQFADAVPTRSDFRRMLLTEHLQTVRTLRVGKGRIA
jgi:hypothetical protein